MALPDVNGTPDTIEHFTVVIADLTVTFAMRCLTASELSAIYERGAAKRHAMKMAAWEELGEAERGPAPVVGETLIVDVQDEILDGGVVSYYSSQDATPQDFERADAEALLADWPRWVGEGLVASILQWSTEGVLADPFVRSNPSGRAAG